MSWPVEHAFWHFWRPGGRYSPSEEERAKYETYLRRAGKRNSEHRLLLLALALDANPLEMILGDSEMAECYPRMATLAERLQRSERTVQRLLAELEAWDEIQIVACNGHCRQRWHHATNHYYLPLPAGAEPWRRRTQKEAREHVRGAQAKRRKVANS